VLEELIPYFNPVILNDEFLKFKDQEFRLVSIQKNISSPNLDEIKKSDIVILGVPEYRNSGTVVENSISFIRNEFYKLYKTDKKIKIYDIGDLIVGKTINDTYTALKDILHILLKNNIIPVIIGGSQDLTYSQFLAHEKRYNSINIVSIDSCLDIGNSEEEFNSKSHIGKIIFNRSTSLFNYTNIGYQTYLVPTYEKELIDKLNFDAIRLGNAKLDISENEPILRDADIISFDIGSIKQSDAPANKNSNPNGFLPEGACQLVKYAGINDKISSIGFYEYNSEFDIQNSTAKLIAQLIWHFIEGFYERKNEFPVENINNYKKFIVRIDDNTDFIFYKSEKTQRWWAEAKNAVNKKVIISCSYNDYLNCVKGDISERIIKFYQKLY
jgi:arginase family enzyme